jgi:hypothetical protein
VFCFPQLALDKGVVGYDDFKQMVLALCIYKNQNPFSPLHQRLDDFFKGCVVVFFQSALFGLVERLKSLIHQVV